MPFEEDYVDFALANAIIEHVGQEAEQRKMVHEMTRVVCTWVITTPNQMATSWIAHICSLPPSAAVMAGQA
jgi:hypothetical protein